IVVILVPSLSLVRLASKLKRRGTGPGRGRLANAASPTPSPRLRYQAPHYNPSVANIHHAGRTRIADRRPSHLLHHNESHPLTQVTMEPMEAVGCTTPFAKPSCLCYKVKLVSTFSRDATSGRSQGWRTPKPPRSSRMNCKISCVALQKISTAGFTAPTVFPGAPSSPTSRKWPSKSARPSL